MVRAKKSTKNKVGFIQKHSVLSGIGAAVIAGLIAIWIQLNKSDNPTADQTCSGDNCIQIGNNSGTINIDKTKKSSDGNEK